MSRMTDKLSKEYWTHIPTDLSKYYIMKKFKHGWLMQLQNSNEVVFIPKDHLIKLGYIRDEKNTSTTPSRKSWEYSGVIVVPIGSGHRRSQSCSEDEQLHNNSEIIKNISESKPIDIITKLTDKKEIDDSLSQSCPCGDIFSTDTL